MMKRKNAPPPYIVNAGLFLALAGALAVAVYRYKVKIETITMSDNRYLTTEWHLLQELKARTDRELHEKDLEISRLRSEYENLLKGDFPDETLRELEAELARAEKERDTILSQRLLASAPESAGSGGAKAAQASSALVSATELASGLATGLAAGPADTASAADAANALSRLLGERITALEAQSAAYRLRAETAEKSLASAESRFAARSVPVQPEPDAETNVETNADSGTLVMLRSLIEERKDSLRAEGSPSLDDLKTRSLLRAIASTPAIKAEYPGLLESMDRFFAAYGKQEWTAGQKDAYSFMLESIDALNED